MDFVQHYSRSLDERDRQEMGTGLTKLVKHCYMLEKIIELGN